MANQIDTKTLAQDISHLDTLEQVVAKFRVLVAKEQEYITEFKDELSKDDLVRHQATLSSFGDQLVSLQKDYNTKRERLDQVLISVDTQQLISALESSSNENNEKQRIDDEIKRKIAIEVGKDTISSYAITDAVIAKIEAEQAEIRRLMENRRRSSKRKPLENKIQNDK